jgi:Domain of unknown function (DUF4145)
MNCPHCRIAIHVTWKITQLDLSHPLPDHVGDYGWQVRYAICPSCSQPIITLDNGEWSTNDYGRHLKNLKPYLVWPRSSQRLCPKQVPIEIAEDFMEAAAVLETSPKASAALSRRCLQQVLVDHHGVGRGNLERQIEKFIETKHPPTHIERQLHVIRQVGNFAAHPQKDQATGEILPVEPEDAEWNLNVLESLFDFTFVQPALAHARIDQLNQKLDVAGKPKL